MMHPAHRPTPTDVLRVSHDGLLGAVPALLGFHPTDSVVLVCMTGPHRRAGPVVRVNTPSDPASTPAVVVVLAHAAHYHADEIAVIVNTDTPDRVDTAGIATGLATVRPVLTAITTGNTPRSVPDVLLAAAVASGRAVLADRAELVWSVAYRPGTPADELLAELDPPVRRDQWIARMLRDPDAVARLITASQSTPDTDPRIGSVCAALAVIAYRHGDGALAQVAIGRSERTNPGHTLTRLIAQVIDAQIPPAALDDLLTA